MLSNSLTTSPPESETFPWEEKGGKEQRRLIYYTLHGIVGLLMVLFNGFVLLAYCRRKKLRKQISLVMMNMFVFCFLHGFIVGIMYPLQRLYRYSMSADVCVFNTLVMDFADNYILVLLPVIAAEKLLHVKYPKCSQTNMRIWSVCSMVLAVVITVCYAWLPLIPNLNVPTDRLLTSDNSRRQEEISRFYRQYSCQYRINKKNYLEPIFTIGIELACVSAVVGTYICLFIMLKHRLATYSDFTRTRHAQLRRAGLIALTVSLTFIFTFLPYGIALQVKNICDTNTSDRSSSLCNGLILELRFVFSLLAHLGNLLAPLLFAILNRNIKHSLLAFLRCGTEERSNSVTFVTAYTTSTNTCKIAHCHQNDAFTP